MNIRVNPMQRVVYYHPTPGFTAEQFLLRHSGQEAQVLRPLRVPEERDPEVGPMYFVRFADGFESDVFGDEIDGTWAARYPWLEKTG